MVRCSLILGTKCFLGIRAGNLLAYSTDICKQMFAENRVVSTEYSPYRDLIRHIVSVKGKLACLEPIIATNNLNNFNLQTHYTQGFLCLFPYLVNKELAAEF